MLWTHGNIYNPYDEDYTQERHIEESEVGVCWYYMDEDWASTHYQKFLKESNQVVLEIIFQMEIDDGE